MLNSPTSSSKSKVVVAFKHTELKAVDIIGLKHRKLPRHKDTLKLNALESSGYRRTETLQSPLYANTNNTNISKLNSDISEDLVVKPTE